MSTTHPTTTRATWLAECIELLKTEKELTHRSDELARRRQALPWVRIDKSYRFETENGSTSLADLFGGRSQLLVYHFMFGPDYKTDCPSYSTIADGFDGFVTHLANHDVTLMAVSRRPLAKLLEYQERMSWNFPWVSSVGSDFNYGFSVSITGDQQRVDSADCDYVRGSHMMDASDLPGPAQQLTNMCGTDAPTYVHDRPSMNVFMLEDDVVYCMYSTHARGLDGLWGAYRWLDCAPLSRSETCVWWRRHDEYA